MTKKWFICLECEYLTECKAGKARTYELSVNSRVYSDVGCFNQEQYFIQKSRKQLRLF